MRRVLLACALSCTACTVNVTVDGRRCPCGDGYQCSEGVCVPAGNCAMGIDAFRASWATPHTIRWEWEPIGVAEDFLEYRLVTGPTEDDVRNRTPLSRTWTSADSPELGEFSLVRTVVVDTVKRTITRGLELDTLYYAQLEIVDTSGCVAPSPNIAGERTTTAMSRVQILRDAVVGSDGELGHVTAGCYDNSPGCWMATVACLPMETTCYVNLHRYTINASVDVSAGEFATAYIAFQYRADHGTPQWWQSVILNFGLPSWYLEPLVFPVLDDYQAVELPLAAFARWEQPVPEALTLLTAADTVAPFDTFSIGVSEAPPGSHVWIDELEFGW